MSMDMIDFAREIWYTLRSGRAGRLGVKHNCVHMLLVYNKKVARKKKFDTESQSQ